jgi:hypothetical protein
MRTHIARSALAALPPWARIHFASYPDKRALKAASRAAMRARERAALDALRHGADPDAATLPTHSREPPDRWAYD